MKGKLWTSCWSGPEAFAARQFRPTLHTFHPAEMSEQTALPYVLPKVGRVLAELESSMSHQLDRIAAATARMPLRKTILMRVRSAQGVRFVAVTTAS
jgi:hypothetical protein